jgi:bifunctional enzyme Fae/Hps
LNPVKLIASLKVKPDIVELYRAITAPKDIGHAADEFLDQLNREEIDRFRVMTDF